MAAPSARFLPPEPQVQAGFEPMLSGFVLVPYNDLPALDQVAALNPNVVAVLVEPVQGEGGSTFRRRVSLRTFARSAMRKAGC